MTKNIRKDVKFLTKKEKKLLIKCFFRLKKVPSPFKNSRGMSYYDHLVTFHMQNSPDNRYAHKGAHFGIWHRHYLLLLEQALNSVKKKSDPYISIPFWNWLDPASTAALFSPDLIGTNGHGKRQLIQDSKFVKFKINVYSAKDHEPIITRAFGNPISTTINNTLLVPVTNLDITAPPNTGCCYSYDRDFSSVQLPDIAQINILLQRPVFEIQPFNDLDDTLIGFRNLLEGWRNFQNQRISVVHNVTHLWTGGTMLTLASPNDPSFWFHHSFVDALYYGWQLLHPYTSNGPTGPGEVEGVGQYNVVLTRVPKIRVFIENGALQLTLAPELINKMNELITKNDNSYCLTKYFAPGYFINIESDSKYATEDAKCRRYESFVINTITDTTITFSQQSTYNTYNFNNIKNGKGYISEVYGSMEIGSNILTLFDNQHHKIKVKYILDLKIGDRISLSLDSTSSDMTNDDNPDSFVTNNTVPNVPENNFLATIIAFGIDGKSVILDRENNTGMPFVEKLVFRQSFYQGSTGNKKIYLGAHYGSNLDDFLVDFPQKNVVIKSLVDINDLSYRYALNFDTFIPVSYDIK